MKAEGISQSQTMTVKVLHPKSRMMREVPWPRLLIVEVMSVSTVQAPVDDSGGAAPVQAEEGSDVANNIDGEYGVPVDEEAEVAEYIDQGGAIQVPVDEGGGAVPVLVD